MNAQIATTLPANFDLTQLAKIPLDESHSYIFESARSACGGSSMWRVRKEVEARELIALAQVSERIAILMLDLRADIRVQFIMRVPVPCMPSPDGPIHFATAAEVGLVYPATAVVEPQPGYSFACLLRPLQAWHPNIGPLATGQRICLGPTLPAGVQIREIIFLLYRLFTLQTAQFNSFDPAGVMNGAAAEWWQSNVDKIPLTNESFISFAKP